MRGLEAQTRRRPTHWIDVNTRFTKPRRFRLLSEWQNEMFCRTRRRKPTHRNLDPVNISVLDWPSLPNNIRDTSTFEGDSANGAVLSPLSMPGTPTGNAPEIRRYAYADTTKPPDRHIRQFRVRQAALLHPQHSTQQDE